MTALIIIGILLLVVSIVLLLPISIDFKFEQEFFLKVKIAGIKVYGIEPEKDIGSTGSSDDTESDKKAEQQEKKLFEKLKNKLGFTGAIKEICRFVTTLIKRTKRYFKHIVIKNLVLDITVAAHNAASTAIEYGGVCTAVYPVLTLVNSVANVKMKHINVKSDFNKCEPEFKTAFVARLRIIYILMIALSAFSEYNNFKMRNEL